MEQVYPIPAEALANDSVVIAVREWLAPARAQSAYVLHGHMLLGDQKSLTDDRTLWIDSFFCESFGDIADGVIAFMIGIWALALFRAQPDHPEYFWLGAIGLLAASLGAFAVCKTVMQLSLMDSFWAYTVPATFLNIAFGLFVCAFLRVRVNGWVKAYCFGQLWWPASFICAMQGWIPMTVFFTVGLLVTSAVDVFGPLLAIRQYRRGDREAGVLLLSLLVSAASDYGSLITNLLNLRRGVHFRGIPNLTLGPASLSPESISEILFYLTIGAIMLRRSMQITREQQRTAAELEAGRSVQTFLLGRDVSAPGFTVESAYLPAQEVGGDFFQTIAGADGSLLAVIGDVAGKGLQAAMRVSMLIGATRLSPNERPAALLAKLNEVLLQDGSSGFTTCLAARLNTDGTATIANAGHLSPYLNGRELAIDGGLPLGVAPGIDYTEQTFPFVAGDLMLLLSDGVVEARNPTGDLFGFERMAKTAGDITTADALAESAKAFGQDDDITVLLLRRAIATH